MFSLFSPVPMGVYFGNNTDTTVQLSMSLFSKFNGVFYNAPKCTMIMFSLMHYLVHYATEQAQNQVPPNHKEYGSKQKKILHTKLSYSWGLINQILVWIHSHTCIYTYTHVHTKHTHTHTHTLLFKENEVKISTPQTDDHQHQLK